MAHQDVSSQLFVDHYETLEVSSNASPDTIHRVYRMLAARFHPDNSETGDEQVFRTILESYSVLSDPERRAAYDVVYRDTWKQTWKIFDQSSSASGVESERRKRQGVLNLLYRKRAMEPETPYLGIRDLEGLLGVPREHLEFTLWYLKDGQFVQRGDNGRFSITLKGVDQAEASLERGVTPMALINSRAS